MEAVRRGDVGWGARDVIWRRRSTRGLAKLCTNRQYTKYARGRDTRRYVLVLVCIYICICTLRSIHA